MLSIVTAVFFIPRMLASANTVEQQLQVLLNEWPKCKHNSNMLSCNMNQYTTECVYLNEFCDNVVNCTSRLDESYLLCSKLTCPEEMFRCSYGACVQNEALCNNITDCLDESDENHKSCNGLQNRNDSSICANDEFLCHSGDQCIHGNQLCDGSLDCEDETDESIIECQEIQCDDPGHMRCSYGGCVRAGSYCDHYVDCPDRSDEGYDMELCHMFQDTDCPINITATEDTEEGHIAMAMFRCQSGQCIPLHKRCDHRKDCTADGSDESEENKCERFRSCRTMEDVDTPNYLEAQGCGEVTNEFEEDNTGERLATGCVLVKKCIGNSSEIYKEFPQYYCYNGNWFLMSDETCIDIENGGAGTVAAVAVVTALFIIFIVLTILYIITIRKERKMRQKILGLQKKGIMKLDRARPVDEQTEALAYDKKWEFPKALLTLGSQLGSGAFGVVIKADALGIVRGEEQTTVAVKMVKRDATQDAVKALVMELKILIHLGKHINTVNLLGACTKNIIKNELYVILEYCPRGNLRDYLINIRGKFQSELSQASEPEYYNTVQQQTDEDQGYGYRLQGEEQTSGENERMDCRTLSVWAFQIARGMEYLSDRRIVHGDLAARNILLAHDNLVKISDFGLARSLYTNPEYIKKSDTPVPIKWLAIESLRDCVFTTQSDVWAFGITLWEIFSLGATPYTGLRGFQELLTRLQEGYRLEKPEHADEKMYTIMQDCWREEPMDRPVFSRLVDTVGHTLEEQVCEYYLNINMEYESSSLRAEADEEDYVMPIPVHSQEVRYVNVHSRQSK